MKTVSILLCAYNAEPFIKEAIDSILRQTYRDFELIMVNDGSTDQTLEIMRSYADERICVVDAGHDYIRSLNIGLDHCHGEFIARLDADDLMEPTRIEEQLKLMRHHEDMTACFTWATAFGEQTGLFGSHVQGWIPTPYFWLLTGNFLQHPTAMIRRDFLEKHNIRYQYYDYAEDYKIWAEMAKCGANFYVYPKPLILHRMDARQVSRVYAHEQWQTRLRIQQEIIEGLLPKILPTVRKDVSAYYESLIALNKARLMQGDRVAQEMYQVLDQLRRRGELVL